MSVSTDVTDRMPCAIQSADTCAAGFEQACAEHEPRFVPAQPHVDDRGWSLMNQFQNVLTPEGQVNYSVMFPGIIKAWHRHQHQTDFWLCLHGHLKVGVQRDSDDERWMLVFGEKKPGVVIIPPPLWHGAATVGPDSAGLLYYVTQQYNAQAPDEQRRDVDALADFPWQVQYR
jgi:dTDP-4-dehydrorhamnose 3,5-epimerase